MDCDREERERAIQEADRLQAEFERDECQLAKQSVPAGVDLREWLASRPKQTTPKPQPQVATMTPEVQKLWDGWCDRRIIKMFEPDAVLFELLAEIVSLLRAEEREHMCTHVANEIKKLRTDLDAEATKLRDEISGLRIDTVVGRSVLRGEINELRETGMKKKVRT